MFAMSHSYGTAVDAPLHSSDVSETFVFRRDAQLFVSLAEAVPNCAQSLPVADRVCPPTLRRAAKRQGSSP